MGRTKKGRDISGWIIIDKPAGPTSTAVVGKVRWAMGAKKAGHAGTLDPAATGVLAVALGEATKTIPFITDALKAYRFTVRWGQVTNTDDAEGEVIEEFAQRPSADDIRAALPAFTGDITQVPPKFSAVKIDGERAYALARDNEDFEIAARPLYVEALDLIEQPDADTAVLEMTCGKGGYVRAIARDLGAALGCGGHVVTLRRIWSGPFDTENAVTLEQIEELAKTPEIDALMQPVEIALDDLPQARLSPAGAKAVGNGNPGEVTFTDAMPGDTVWGAWQGQAVAIGTYLGGMLHPNRVLNRTPAE
ncbi:tRNA pseudouridine(55) synthase TruB [Alphaproteobacteria bacterium KMM 3653]|uniref:tRNA pseudouridine synthase B n=1 Tax=Harenicola maris TaxID=2841044 RepID=A0AAP2CQE4_9RHOB|nr:tRNA pseudouridine(55) synthase TruB [Harenicola maris]